MSEPGIASAAMRMCGKQKLWITSFEESSMISGRLTGTCNSPSTTMSSFHMPGPDGQFGRREIGLVTNSNPLGIDPNDPAGKDDIVVLGELHVPVNRPLIIELSSKDVIHNFDLPHMRIAADAIPGSLIPMWFKPIKTGNYEVVCGQL